MEVFGLCCDMFIWLEVMELNFNCIGCMNYYFVCFELDVVFGIFSYGDI